MVLSSMTDAFAAVLAAFLSGALTLLGTIITVRATTRKSQNSLTVKLEVLRADFNNLKAEVEKHNNYAVRVPRLEGQMQTLMKEVFEK